MQQKNIVTCVILSIVTCGIYGIIWMIALTDDTGRMAGDSNMKGSTAVLLTIVTCGIYGYFWAYKMGELLTKAQSAQGKATDSNYPVLFLVLQICSLGIVNFALIQNELNKMVA